jgi:hypothetical protein
MRGKAMRFILQESDLRASCGAYRGTSEDFVPEAANRTAWPADTFIVDMGVDAAGGYCYKLSAVDVYENESGFAVLRPDTGAIWTAQRSYPSVDNSEWPPGYPTCGTSRWITFEGLPVEEEGNRRAKAPACS